MRTAKSFLPFFLGIVIFLSILIFFHFRGVVEYDEGYILNSALKVSQGKIPYVDFDIVYTPISFLFTALSFKLFGASVFSGRLAALFVSCLSLFGLYKLLILITKRKLLIFSGLLLFTVWGPAHINFPWPTMFAACFYIYALLFFMYGVTSEQRKYFFFAGIATALTVLSKQNFGAGALVVSSIAFFFINLKNKKNQLLGYYSGVVLSALITILLLLATSSLGAFIQSLYVNTFLMILVQKVLDTPFLYQGAFFIRIAKLVFYLSPLIVSVVAIFSVYRQKKNMVVIGLFAAGFYVMGVRPTTDYDHIVSLIAMSTIAFVVVIEYTYYRYIRSIAVLLLLAFILLGLYTAYFSGYYKWDAPLRYDTLYDSNPRIGVYLTPYESQRLDHIAQYIDQTTQKNDSIFVNYYNPLIYFVSDRENVTKFDYLNIPDSYQQQVIKDLRTKKVKMIITSAAAEKADSRITQYIKKNYKKDTTIDDYIVYRLR